jgi:uncharacterized SAM-binding protein YcdF (DUF218 family)
MRWVVRLATVALLAILVYEVITFGFVYQASRSDDAQRAGAIVVFGAAQYGGRPSPVLKGRLDHALKLWRQRLAPFVVVTGGRRAGDRVTEATAAANYLMQQGVPDRAILREVQGTTSWDSLAATSVILRERGLETVVLVSDPYHAARIVSMASELGLQGYASPAREVPISQGTELKRMARETLIVSVSRVVGYRRVARVREPVSSR